LCELEDGVAGNLDSLVFKNKGSPTLKYIIDVIDRTGEAGIYIQFKKLRVQSVKLAKSQNISKIVYHTFVSMSHTRRWRSVSCCWDMHW
jgi:hypothetical protein